MLAYGLDFNRRRPAAFRLPEPAPPKRGEVLLRVRQVGICGTDRELARFRFGQPPPGESRLVLGHEALCEVIETGPGVSNLQPGDFVVPMIRRSCRPACPGCRGHRRDLCVTGRYRERGIFRAHGYLMPYTLDRAEDLHLIPPALIRQAILVESFSVVEKAVETAFRLHPLTPRRAVVFGAGPVGLLSALALELRGVAAEVVSLEPPDDPRALIVRQAGISYRQGSPSASADLAFEAAGATSAAGLALQSLAPLGVLILIGAADGILPLPLLDTVVGNRTVAGIVNAGPGHFQAAIEDLAKLPKRTLNSMLLRQSLKAWPEALDASPGALKNVLLLG